MADNASPSASAQFSGIPLVVAMLLVLGFAAVACNVFLPGDDALLREAAQAFVHYRYADAEKLALEHAKRFPRDELAWVIAGESAAKLHADDRALAHFRRVPESDSVYSVRALHGQALRLMRQGRARDAERVLRRALSHSPHHVAAAQDLVYLLEVQGRSWEALPYLRLIIRSGKMAGDHLKLACSTEMEALGEPFFVSQCLEAVPDDPLPLLGQARQNLRNNNRQAAEATLQEIVEMYPTLSEAQARLGRLYLDAEDAASFLAWQTSLPADLPPHPDLWVNQGLWASRQGQTRAAARCFWEAVRLHPHHGFANYQLSQALGALGDRTAAEAFGDRARKLSKLDYLLADLSDDDDMYREIALRLEELGRHWEAAAWCQAAWSFRVRPAWAGPELTRLAHRLASNATLAADDSITVLHIDLSDFPLPEFRDAKSLVELEETGDANPFGDPHFINVAHEAGLDFQYYNGQDPKAGRAYMFEFQGGGAAVLDYDNDGWPDVYLTQGCHWPPNTQDQQHRDRLFRNLGGGRFRDVTDESGLGDNGLSGGVTIGDFDNDGWPDIYVCNVGPNRLYHNNGDGTFRDITEPSGTAGKQWSTGAAFGDFNQDGWPDLYVLNYVGGNVLERACFNEGQPVQCGPTLFPAEQDRLYLNLGNGSFRDVTEDSGIVAPDGKGLGIVVADFDGSGRLGIFIANDTTANFLFRNRTSASGETPRFTEEALLSGVAFDPEGNAQACMGIAAGDANEDERLDLFVTNFYRQANALYVQDENGLFRDHVRKAGLFDPSFLMLGWGTQFLDAELDTRPDLALVNGHVNDFRSAGTPYHMRAQVMRKTGREGFKEVPAETLGPYFSELHLGRALARLDWNRDGKEDFLATHIDAPTALLENRTTPVGHYLAVRLVGTRGSRDAIGAEVQVEAGGRTQRRQLTSGDGFQASNQRVLVFGLGQSDRVDRLKIRWPGSATETVLTDVPVDEEVTIIEGAETAFRTWSADPASNNGGLQ